MNQLTVFEQREVLGKEFRMYGTPEQPLFLAKDVAEWIEHSNSSVMLSKVDEDEKILMLNNVYNQVSTHGGVRKEQWFLTEDGLYEVLMQSRKPIAKEFKKEVKTILKQIRMTGGYIPVSAEESDEEFLARALVVAQRTLSKKDEIIRMKDKQLEEQAPKVEAFAHFIENEESSVEFKILAANLGIGKNELLSILRNHRVLMTDEYMCYDKTLGKRVKRYGAKHNVPYAKYDRFFEVKQYPTDKINRVKVLVRPKGQEFIRKSLVKHGYIQERAA
ncbi:MAG TPA: phage antirepressor Ant [Lachnospiraceae bacterium]|nr:BRO family protein [uncultured Lachnoclostridium sp.]HAU85070.1 phage antirepressor Ant [Lachnospiraceae bacterium]